MSRRYGVMITATLVLGFVGLVILMGCDKSLRGDDPFSPTADVRIAEIWFPSGIVMAPFIGAVQGTETTTPVTGMSFPDLYIRVANFNGVSVHFTRFMIEFFQQDGTTPLGVPPLNGFMDRFMLGGYPHASGLDTIAPTANSTGFLVFGITSVIELRIPGVSAELAQVLLARVGRAQDKTDLAIGVVTIFGEDINHNDIRISGRYTIRPVLPYVPISGE
ncbi:MAG: hypothetical protein HY815_13205 [Candidatus Riflebacteria bacterium]|nr:hypothetical protein [Candidatus Riflebacteria bacterium]